MERLAAERARLAARLKELRKQAGITQEEAAELTGLHYTYVARLERAKASASLSTLVAFALVFKIELRELF